MKGDTAEHISRMLVWFKHIYFLICSILPSVTVLSPRGTHTLLVQFEP